MGGWSLTKPGLYRPGQAPVFYGSTPEAMAAASAQLPNADPSVVNLPPQMNSVVQSDYNPTPGTPQPQEQGPPVLQTQGGGPQFSTPPTGPLPMFYKPSFKDATTDQYGNASVQSPGSLSKLGWLMTMLKGGVQGASDAVSGGALNAVPGRSSFGAGAEAAYQMPLLRASMQRQQALQAADIQNKMADTNQKTSQAQLNRAEVPSKGMVVLPRAGAVAINPQTGVTVSAPDTDKNTPIDQQTFNALTSPGANGEAPSMTPVQAYAYLSKVAADAKADAKPDAASKATQDYQATMTKLASEFGPGVGSLDPGPLAKVIAGSKTLSQPEKDAAIAYPIAHTTPGATKQNMVIRMEGMQNAREYPVINNQTGNLEYRSAADINASKGSFTPAAEGGRSMQKEALINDIRVSANNVRNNLSVLDSGPLDRAKLAASLADPNSTAEAYLQAIPRGYLNDQQSQFVSDLFNLREQAMAMRSVLGAGGGSEDVRKAILSTLPSIASNSKMGGKQLDNLQQVLTRLERGVPNVPLRPQGNTPQPAPASPHQQLLDQKYPGIGAKVIAQ